MHRHSPTAPQRYPSSSKRQTVIDEQTISASCEPLWTSGNARSPPPRRSPDQPGRRRIVRTPATDSSLSGQRATLGTRLRGACAGPYDRRVALTPGHRRMTCGGLPALVLDDQAPDPREPAVRGVGRLHCASLGSTSDRPTVTRPPICATSNAIFAASSVSRTCRRERAAAQRYAALWPAGVGCGIRPEPRARPVVGPRGVGQRAVLPSMTRAAQPSGGAQAGTAPGPR